MESQKKSMNLLVYLEKERKKVNNIRKNYTLSEVKTLIKFYDKNKSIREISRKFNFYIDSSMLDSKRRII